MQHATPERLASEDPYASAFVTVRPHDLAAGSNRRGRVHQTRRLVDALVRLIDTGKYDLGLEAIDDVDEAASRMVAALPGMDPWNSLIGPFYREPDVLRWLRILPNRLRELEQHGEILAVTTLDGISLYPSFQFGSNGELLPHLSAVLAILDPDHLEPWDAARWLNRFSMTLATTPARALRTLTPVRAIEHAKRFAAKTT